MEQIVIRKANGNTLPLFSRERPSAVSKATQKVALLADDLVNITVVSAAPIDFDFGDTITVFGKPYRLNQLPQPTKEGERKFTYELTLEGLQYDLIDVIYHLPETAQDNPERVYYGEHLYADLEEHLKALLWNIERIYPGKWKLGTYPNNTDFKNLTATGKNCLQVLQEYCSEFGVEFEIAINASNNTYTLNIREKVGGTFSQTLHYGRGKGLYKLQRKNVNNAGITTRLYVYGGNSNLGNNYGHTRLCLHDATRLTSFVEDAAAKEKYGIKENEKTFEDIKPERVGEVAALGANILTFADSGMFDLNEREKDGTTTKYLIPDTTAKITFQTGNLAGYSFDIHSYNHKTHTFVINKFTDENGLVFPNETSAAFQIAQGDKYILTDINLPDEYILDAEAKLKEAADKELANICQPQVSYTLQLDEQFFTRIYGRTIPAEVLHVGDYLHIVDEQIGVDKEIRITQIERDLLKPHAYTIQVSDTLTKTTTVRVLNDLQNLNEIVNINGLADPTVARRRWKTAQELLSMVFDPDGDYYTDRIKPLSVDTSMLSVGAKSQQFVLQNVTFEPNYNGDYTFLRISAGYMTHYAIDPDNLLTRAMPELTVRLDTLSAYYIYASWQRAGSGTYWLVTKEQKRVDENADEWLFLVGTISSPVREGNNAVRSVALTYGFSTINGRFIKTGRIESTAGSCYFDLDNNEIGGVIQFVKSDGTTANVADVDDRTNETKDYINNILPGILNDIQAQIDGQIEQFFYDHDPDNDSEPTSEWIAADTANGTNAEREKHLGDLFYNTDTGKVFRFVKENVVYKWQELSDAEVAQALSIANDAMALAQNKRRVFVAQPYPPYDLGDLWLTGDNTNGQLMRCITARTTGTFLSTDWTEAVYYDNTKTTINGGIVTSGTVQLVSPVSESIVAGITGGENETSSTSAANKVRIWAGASKNNRYSAPFRVLQDGTVHATKANIEGMVKATSGEFRGTIYATDGEFNGRVYIGGGAIQLNKDGSGSLGNGKITWQAEYGAATIPILNVNQFWGFNQLIQNLNNATSMWENAAMFILPLGTSETIKLTTSPNTARMYTFINLTPYQKELHGNGRKIWIQGNEYDSIYMTSYSGGSKRYIQARTVTMMCDDKWYVVSAY